jgi:diguanylate cyclase (GGDEF)-like protein
VEHILIFIILGIGFLSFVPVISLNKNRENKKYGCLRYLINLGFFWTILIFLERLSGNMNIVYVAHVIGYPIKFLLVSFMVCTIFNYIEKPMPKLVIYILGFITIVEVALAITNIDNQYLIQIIPSQMNNFTDLYAAQKGSLYIYHLIMSYLVLVLGIGYLFYFLSKHKTVRQYKSITQTMAISIIIVLVFNLSQFLFIQINADLTYISLVVVSYTLYRIIYMKDMVFNIRTSGRSEILSNMREMYIITDSNYHVIEISRLLITKYNINEEEYTGKILDKLINKLEEYISFYKEYTTETEDDSSKDHFHLRDKKFKLMGMNDYGYIILLYDETKVFRLLRDLNKLSNYDNMTGLNNRNYIENKLNKLEQEINLGIISLDLNGLKVNNDYLGHERGDFLLKSLANKIKYIMSKYENKDIARIGGDEFVIILYDTEEMVLQKIKNDILEVCDNPDLEKRVSVSIGTAFSKNNINVFKLLQEADANMYEMKKMTSEEYSESIIEYVKKKDKFIR